MDRIISICGSLTLAALLVLVAWLFSGGWDWLRGGQQPLGDVLAALGGPLGFWGGAAYLVVFTAAMYGMHQAVNFYTAMLVIYISRRRGQPPEVLAEKVRRSPLSQAMKRRLLVRLGKAGGPEP